MDGKRQAGIRDDLVRYVRSRFANVPGMDLACEDVVDEAFAAVLAGPRAAELADNFAYMARVASNLACRAWRASRRDSELDAGLGDPDLLAGGDGAELPAFRGEAVAAIAASLDALRDVERSVIHQRYWEGLAFAEIARRSGLPLGTVLSLHHRALARLRPLVARYFGEEAQGEGPFPGAEGEAGAGPYSRYF
jgi:RNA polymerase sigma factor (sigma-70 family)